MGVAAGVNPEQDRRYNRKTGDLDKAIRLLNEFTECERTAQYHRARACGEQAVRLLAPIAELLTIDSEAKL